jgi:hypothetical protein
MLLIYRQSFSSLENGPGWVVTLLSIRPDLGG